MSGMPMGRRALLWRHTTSVNWHFRGLVGAAAAAAAAALIALALALVEVEVAVAMAPACLVIRT
jgi:hypothetical protein